MKQLIKNLSIFIIIAYLLVPLLATFLYSFATEWNYSVLPEGLTLNWYQQLFSDERFLAAMGRSLLLTGLSTIAATVIMVPAIYGIIIYYPAFERVVKWAIIGVYALPGVILSVGLLKGYSNAPVPMIVVIAGAYIISVLPFMYQGISNSMRNIQVVQLVEAAELLGASKLTAFRRIIIPNIMQGVIVAALLSFSILFGEFVIINLILGSGFETVQIYLMQNLKRNGHISSAIVGCYFILLAVITLVILKLTAGNKGEKMNELYPGQPINEEIQ